MPELTIHEVADNVLIDGCAVPKPLYRKVRDEAIRTQTTQVIGVIYEQPEHLKPLSGDPWGDYSAERYMAMRHHLRTGQHLVYIFDKTRDELFQVGECLMILYVSPKAEEL